MSNYIHITVNGSRVVNAQASTAKDAAVPEWMDGINQVTCGSGPEPGYGKFLISCTDYAANWPETEPFRIDIQRKCGDELTTIQLDGYSTVAAYRSRRSQDAAWVVEVADARFFMRTATTNRSWNVSDTDSSWQDVLDDLIDDLPADALGTSGFVGELEYATEPTHALSNLKYEGWRTLEALADLASRTGHVLVYDPFLVSLKLENMRDTQIEGADAMKGASVHRQYDAQTVPADDIGEVRVNYDLTSGEPAEYTDVINPDSTAPQRASAWATPLVDDPSDVTDEVQVLADTWFDWSYRALNRVTFEYFGNLEVPPGSEVSTVTWILRDNECYTFTDIYAPPEPVTKRQEVSGIHILKIGITDELIAFGTSGPVSVWERDSNDILVDTGETISASYLDWLTGENISAGKMVLLAWFPNEGPSGLWRIIDAECEDGGEPNLFQATSAGGSQVLTTTWTEVSGMYLNYTSGAGIVPTAPP